MPSAPPRHNSPVTARPKREHDRKRYLKQHWRRWYSLAIWKRRRAAQLARDPLCRMCDAAGRATAATVADHVTPHRGDWTLFVSGELMSLCGPCHDSAKQSQERGGQPRRVVGVDGLPINPRSSRNQ